MNAEVAGFIAANGADDAERSRRALISMNVANEQ